MLAGATLDSTTGTRLRRLGRLLGNTPMLAIELRYRGRRRIIYAKSEQLNMTGSIKDRMAFHILRRACEDGSLSPGDTIAEATSGNTGIAFAALGRALGHQVVILMPDWMSRERMELVRRYGARLVLVSREEGGFLGLHRARRSHGARTGWRLPPATVRQRRQCPGSRTLDRP